MTEQVEDITTGLADLTVLSFRTLDDARKLDKHFRHIITHPLTESNPAVKKYLVNLNETHKRILTQKREYVEVEYIFTTEKKSNLQRQRFNSLPISEVPELLKAELLTAEKENAKQVHICTDCNVEIELNDEEPLMESLQKHFNLEIHQPKPKMMKRESVDVSEPVILPNMSRRLSAMECGETTIDVSTIVKQTEKLERNLSTKLSAALLKHLPDNSEATIGAALKFYQESYDKLCFDVTMIDFTSQTSSVAPIIMSIRDNVYQNFAADANKNTETDENEPGEKPKTQAKKYRYYGPIENTILELLTDHKLLTLVDDRTGKLAFFCIACEYYTLRFHYDSVLNHVFSETHVHNLSCILQSDNHVPFRRFLATDEPSIKAIKKINYVFLYQHQIVPNTKGFQCNLCNQNLETIELTILHILDDKHLGKLSDELVAELKKENKDGSFPEDWGPKDLNWSKYLASSGKPQNKNDHVIIENFIKPSGKIGNYCTCCDMTLKGPRQVLFNHIRQKKHLRNAAPRKLSLLYKNHCRPSEFYASFGNYYICSICPDYVALPSFAAIVEHFESDAHYESISKIIRCALFPENGTEYLLTQKINLQNGICDLCSEAVTDATSAVKHVLSSVEHQTAMAEDKYKANKGDIISVYMKGNYILHNEGAQFNCISCLGVFNSIRSLLTHLVYANHFVVKPSTESVFRFYLELKHNINMLGRNKYHYYDFGKLRCGVCEGDLEDGENAKRHVVSTRHRDNMGASYLNIDANAVE